MRRQERHRDTLLLRVYLAEIGIEIDEATAEKWLAGDLRRNPDSTLRDAGDSPDRVD